MAVDTLYTGGRVRTFDPEQPWAEAIGVTFLMHGGPATIYGARAYNAFCEFANAKTS